MANRYWVGGTGTWDTTDTTHWSASSGGSNGASVPTSSDSVFFDSGSGSPGTITCTGVLNCLDFTTSVSGWTITQTSATISVYGNFTLNSGTTWSLNNQLIFAATTGTPTITTNGVSIGGPVVVNNTLTSTTQAIVGAFTSTFAFTVSGSSRFNFGSGTVTLPSMTLSATGLLSYSGPILLTGSGTVFNQTTYPGVTGGSSSASISFTSASPKTAIFPNSGQFAGPLLQQSGAGALTINTTTGTGSITFLYGLTNTVSPTSILVTAGLTFSADVILNGTAGNLVTFSSTSASTFVLNAYNTDVKTSTYCNVSYVNAGTSGGTVLWRFLNSTNGGNNTNLTFANMYYWVGGSGTWDNANTTHWSLSSGGSGGAGVPTQNDDVVFNSSSNTASYIVSNSSAIASCFNLTIGAPASGSVSINPAFLYIYGNFTATSSSNISVASQIYYSNSVPATLTPNGVTFGIFNNLGTAILTLGGALVVTVELAGGGGGINTSTSNYSITTPRLDTGEFGAGTFTFNASTITITGYNSTSIYTLRIGSSCTVNAGTSTINVTGANTETYLIQFGGKTFYNVTLNNGNYNGVTYNITDTGTNTFNAFSYNGSSTAPNLNTLTLSGNITATVLYLNAVNANYTNRLFVKSDTIGTQRTITWSSTIAANFCDFRDINNSTSILDLSGSGGDCGGNSNITFPTTKTVYWNLAGTQNWSATGWATSSGGTPAAANFPLAQDIVSFDNTGAAGTVTIDKNWNIGTINAVNRSTSMTLSTGTTTPTIYGSWYTPTAITRTGTGTLTFSGRSSLMYISDSTSGTMTFTQPITLDAPGGFLQMPQPWTISNAFTLTRGTLNLINSGFGSYTLTCQSFSSSSTNTRTIAFGAGQINVTGSDAIIWDTSQYTNLTVTGTPTVNFTYSGSTGVRDIKGPNSPSGSGTTPLVNVNITAGSDFVYLDNGTFGNYLNVNFTGFTGGFQIYNGISAYGNFTLGSGMTVYTSTYVLTFRGTSGTQTLTTNGVTVNFPIVQNNSGATVQLGSSFTGGNTYTLTAGTLSANNYNVTIPSLTATGSSTRSIIMGSETWTISGSGTAWDCSTPTNLSVTPGTSKISMTSASTKTFAGGGKSWGILNQGGAGALTITGNNTFADIQTTSLPSTITFPASGTTTVSAFTASGTAGNLLTLQSSSAGTQFNISKSSGTVQVGYLSIKDSNATGGANWRAGTTSTFVSNVTGWLLLDPPTQVRARINSSGILFVPNFNQLDEVSKSVNSVDNNALYSNLFDETQSLDYNGIPVAQRKTADGKLLVSGYFDETTLQ